MESAAIAVKQSIDRSWARNQVGVAMDPSGVILRGLVDNDQERGNIERLAQRAAPGMRIENQIAVRRR